MITEINLREMALKKNKTQIKANGYDIEGKLHVFLTMHAKINY